MDGLRELGLCGLQIPTDFGGLGLSNTSYARVMGTYDEDVARTPFILVTLSCVCLCMSFVCVPARRSVYQLAWVAPSL